MLSICSPQLGLAPESNSGGEVYDREVITRLCQKGTRIHALLPKGRTYQQHKNLHLKFAPIQPMVPPHIFSLFCLPYLIKTYRQQKFDLLRVHNPYFIGLAAAVFKQIYPQVPILASYLHLEQGINHLISRLVTFSFDHIITISQNTKEEIVARLKYPKNKITVAYPGIDQRFQPSPKPADLINKLELRDKTVLLFVGGLKKRKNPGFLLKLLAQLNQPRTVLVFAGTGPLLKNLKLKTKNLNLSHQVRFPGFIAEKDKPKYYRLADVLLLPSLKEGFGMTITEAGACAIPAIGSDNSSIKEIIVNQRTGFLAQPNNLDDWAKSLLQLIKSKPLRQKMGQAARKHVRQQFSWNNNIKIHLKVLNQLIA